MKIAGNLFCTFSLSKNKLINNWGDDGNDLTGVGVTLPRYCGNVVAVKALIDQQRGTSTLHKKENYKKRLLLWSWNREGGCLRENLIFSLTEAGLVLLQILSWDVCDAEHKRTQKQTREYKWIGIFCFLISQSTTHIWKLFYPSSGNYNNYTSIHPQLVS